MLVPDMMPSVRVGVTGGGPSCGRSGGSFHRRTVQGDVPVRLEQLEPALLLFPVLLLVRVKLLDQLRLGARVPERLPVLEDEDREEGPVAASVAVKARRECLECHQTARLDLRLEQRVVVLLEERQELVLVSPFYFVVIGDRDGPAGRTRLTPTVSVTERCWSGISRLRAGVECREEYERRERGGHHASHSDS